MGKKGIGVAAWHDLTVKDAEGVRDFYKSVIGWESQPVDMGGYADFNMVDPTSGEAAAGVCHARGTNAKLPPQWLIYFLVENVDRSAVACRENGGVVLDGPRALGSGRFCVVQDPAGAVCALYQE